MFRRLAQACCGGGVGGVYLRHPINRNRIRLNTRSYVKAVDWASPGGSASAKKRWSSEDDECKTCQTLTSDVDDSAPKFAVVAALSKNRVIGMEGDLPWSLPEDRQHFEDLTRDKVLIIGRRTLDEREDGSHISHVRHSIVVSTTVTELDSARYDTKRLSLARSFNDALVLAGDMTENNDCEAHNDNNEDSIDCWVGGGERIYAEALKHPKCQEVHLTQVDVEIDFDPSLDVTLFPRKYIWDRHFALHEKREGNNSGTDNTPNYEFIIYKRKAFLNSQII